MGPSDISICVYCSRCSSALLLHLTPFSGHQTSIIDYQVFVCFIYIISIQYNIGVAEGKQLGGECLRTQVLRKHKPYTFYGYLKTCFHIEI